MNTEIIHCHPEFTILSFTIILELFADFSLSLYKVNISEWLEQFRMGKWWFFTKQGTVTDRLDHSTIWHKNLGQLWLAYTETVGHVLLVTSRSICWSGGLMLIDESQLLNWSTAPWDTIMDCQGWYAELSVNHLVTRRPPRSASGRFLHAPIHICWL